MLDKETGALLHLYLKFGGAKRDRTADLCTASATLSQLSYSPKKNAFVQCFVQLCPLPSNSLICMSLIFGAQHCQHKTAIVFFIYKSIVYTL